jgi:hypothetical protein
MGRPAALKWPAGVSHARRKKATTLALTTERSIFVPPGTQKEGLELSTVGTSLGLNIGQAAGIAGEAVRCYLRNQTNREK